MSYKHELVNWEELTESEKKVYGRGEEDIFLRITVNGASVIILTVWSLVMLFSTVTCHGL